MSNLSLGVFFSPPFPSCFYLSAAGSSVGFVVCEPVARRAAARRHGVRDGGGRSEAHAAPTSAAAATEVARASTWLGQR